MRLLTANCRKPPCQRQHPAAARLQRFALPPVGLQPALPRCRPPPAHGAALPNARQSARASAAALYATTLPKLLQLLLPPTSGKIRATSVPARRGSRRQPRRRCCVVLEVPARPPACRRYCRPPAAAASGTLLLVLLPVSRGRQPLVWRLQRGRSGNANILSSVVRNRCRAGSRVTHKLPTVRLPLLPVAVLGLCDFPCCTVSFTTHTRPGELRSGFLILIGAYAQPTPTCRRIRCL